MSDTVIVSIPLISREQQDSVNLREHRDIYNLLKWCRWATFVVFIFCVFLDAYVIVVLESRYVSNHPGMRQDEVAMQKMYTYALFLDWVVILIQIPLIFFGVTPVILTFGRGPSTAKRWVVNVLRDGDMRSGF